MEFNDQRYHTFLKCIHQAMCVFTLAGGVVLGTQFSKSALYAYVASCGLMWLNVSFLVMGIYGILQKRKSMVMLLVGQSVLLLGGLFCLTHFFPTEILWIILGCSTWLGALFWAQSIDRNQNPIPEKT